jgi:undecaprenyl phosphate-alpha-L-ara4FN deformylase
MTTSASWPRRIALKIDVNTLRGTMQGVPRLAEALRRHGAGATFLFALGPDRTGRAIKHLFRPGFMAKVKRNAVITHHGLRTMLYGTLLPAPDIGRRCADIMRGVRDAGFETGIHAWDRVLWEDRIASARADWTTHEMQRAIERFAEIFGNPARVHAAPGWQMNAHSYRLTQRLGFDYCSDTRGSQPFIPVLNAEIVACPQIPTTLPTCDELIGLDGVTATNIAERIMVLATSLPAPAGHVFTLRAELEGLKLLPAFEQLLSRWKSEKIELLSLGAYLEAAGAGSLPRHRVGWATLAGANGMVCVQGDEFLA